MHYRNGREAKNGDEIVKVDTKGRIVAVGVLYGAFAGRDQWIGNIAKFKESLTEGACVVDCLHVDDVAAMLAEKGLCNRPADKS